MKNLFLTLAGIFASIPGLLILRSGLGVPPSESGSLYGGIIETCGCLHLLMIQMNRSYFRTVKLIKLNKIVSCFFLVFFISLLSYVSLYNFCVVQYPNRTDTLFPIWNQIGLKEEIVRVGGRENLLKFGSDQVKLEIDRLSKFSYITTKIIFLVLYQSIFTSLVICFGLGAIRTEKQAQIKTNLD